MAARVARMTSTSSISTRVNPCWALRTVWFFVSSCILIFIPESLDVFLHRKDRQHHADEDRPDKRCDKKQQQRLRERHRRLQLPIQVALRDIGDAHQLLLEPAALFSHGNHFHHRAREQALALRETGAQLAALLNALDTGGNRIDQNLIANGFAPYVQPLDQRDARAQKCSEHSAGSEE